MSRSWVDRYALGIADDGVALLDGQGQTTLLSASSADDGLLQLSRQLQSSKQAPAPRRGLWRPRLQASVADSLARYWLVQPPANASSLTTLRAVAQARFEQLFGTSAGQWRITADWAADRPFLATALPATLCDAVVQLADVQGWRLQQLQPALVRNWNRHAGQLPTASWFCLAQEHSLTYAVVSQDRWLAVRQLNFASPPTASALLDLLTGEARRLSVQHPALPTEMCWLGIASWLPREQQFGDWHSRLLLSADSTNVPATLAARLALQGGAA
ncbi:hypothetical protein [Chitinimonas naiadis]